MNDYYLELDYYQICKHKQIACGDSFYSRKFDDRVVAVMADGLGSGIKANVLSTLTTSMASKFISSKMDIKRASEVIMQTLPVCSFRKIGYSTFTIIDADFDGNISIVEHDNPSFVLIRDGVEVAVKKKRLSLETDRESKLYYSNFKLSPQDRVVFYSDGVSQAGMGLPYLPLGWQEKGVNEYLLSLIKEDQGISAGQISKKMVQKALYYDGNKAADDITCAAIYLRKPRQTLILSGPPYNPGNDKKLAEKAFRFDGNKIVCGGTTAAIVSRELKVPLSVNLHEAKNHNGIPPTANMKGFDLVTEGTITLSKLLKTLEEDPKLEDLPEDTIKKLFKILLDSDIIRFMVGTKINEAHQDPALPEDLEIRRNLIKQISSRLETIYLKKTTIEYI